MVTGGARGIGLAVVAALAAEGMSVACLDVAGADYAAFAHLCVRAGVDFRSLPVDVRDRDATFGALAAAAELGPIRYAVNCAGIDSSGPSATISAHDWSKVINVDLDGLFYSCQAQYSICVLMAARS